MLYIFRASLLSLVDPLWNHSYRYTRKLALLISKVPSIQSSWQSTLISTCQKSFTIRYNPVIYMPLLGIKSNPNLQRHYHKAITDENVDGNSQEVFEIVHIEITKSRPNHLNRKLVTNIKFNEVAIGLLEAWSSGITLDNILKTTGCEGMKGRFVCLAVLRHHGIRRRSEKFALFSQGVHSWIHAHSPVTIRY